MQARSYTRIWLFDPGRYRSMTCLTQCSKSLSHQESVWGGGGVRGCPIISVLRTYDLTVVRKRSVYKLKA